MPERLRVAVVGCGIGVYHINAYQSLPELFELVAICDIDRGKAERVAAEHAIPRVTTDLAELCRMDDVEVIDICTPPHLHFAQVQQVLAAGKHAICEKPLVQSLQAVDALITAEAQAGRRVMPIFQYRFGHGLQKLKLLVDSGLAGTPYLATVETAWRRRADYYAVPWRGKWATELGGVLLGHAIHAHDMLCYVLGPIRRVFARTATRVNPIEVEDCASVSLEMANGALASLSATLGSAAEITRHRFCFSGLVAESNSRPYSNAGDPWSFTGDTPELEQQIAAALERFQPLPEGFAGQFLRFYHALRSGGELPVTLADARAALELITAMYFSAQTGEDVVLPIGPDHPKYASWLP
ncbi:Gfo/Idh/MocA family protein [Kallotenue papyrolyticum]|uniref:Gfo/Idh/MocA family protein n=1 Tax=Kallotenue papyrolyticum TaxID=1325125 RepID=UPI00046F11EB|nr:Gfo/Idh/MocA family oxidoreductase [Kallotenue papyrolyticum]